MSAPAQASDQQQASNEALAVTLVTLVAAQAASRANLTAQAVAMATAAARSFTGWYDSGQITAWATALAIRIETLQRAAAQQTDAYLARALSQLTGGRVRPVGRIDVSSLRAGITHAGAYGRAADVYRWQQSRFDRFARDVAALEADSPAVSPLDLIDPVKAAVDRVAAVADMDIQLADRAQSAQVLNEHADRHEIAGYRRVIHPELSRGGTCGLCIAASDRVYSTAELKAVHGRCECTVLPIVGADDPGSGLNNLDLRALYKHAGSTSGIDLKRTRYKIDEHGELGPVLTDGTFRSSRQAARDTNRGRGPKTATRTREDIDRILALELSAQDKAHSLATADPKKWGGYTAQLDARIADLRRQLAQHL